MTKPELFEKLTLFYYFALLDEAKAQAATLKTIRKLKWRLYLQGRKESDLKPQDFVAITQNIYNRFVTNTKPVSLALSVSSISLPESSNWGPWFELRKTVDAKDFCTTLYSKILNISDDEIAAGLKVTSGTVRYRIGRTLKTLGHFCRSSGVQFESN